MNTHLIEFAQLRRVTEASAPGARIAFQSIAKRFDDRSVLRGIDLTIEPGEFVAIVGRSGCGKSTLLRIAAGLESVDGGLLRIDGPRSANQPEVRMMFQDARLLPWKSVMDNVAIGLRPAARRNALDVLDRVGLGKRANDWPSVLSGGQRQRVALARALVHQPALLLLDEPLGALDALTRIDMQQLIEGLWLDQRFTALLVTHDVSEAIALADRVVLIDEGRITLDLRIRLPRPRERGSARFAALEEIVLREVLGNAPGTDDDFPPFEPDAVSASRLRWAI